MTDGLDGPVNNAEFRPGVGATSAPPFAGTLRVSSAAMQTTPVLSHPVIGGRDARIFPGIVLSFFTVDDILVSTRRGEMLAESIPGRVRSYWDVIPQFGRVWREKGAGGWSRAAFPLMLVNDTENHAHQGLATFLYQEGAVGDFRFQFVQQTAPYLLRQHFVAWGAAAVTLVELGLSDLGRHRARAQEELAARLPARPWSELVSAGARAGSGAAAGAVTADVAEGVTGGVTVEAAGSVTAALCGFGGPVKPQWRVATALVRDGTLYYQDVVTPYGQYPYPLEMRFGVRSVMKSVAVPLALLRLAQTQGPAVLNMNIGDYVPGLDPKYARIRFIDAANMASGFGGTGTFVTDPNDINDGYLGGDYDAWYLAPSHDEKVAQISRDLRPYPWEPGAVVRYRDQDFYLLGVAIDRFLKSVQGPRADAWDMLRDEVFAPIGIAQAPAIRTHEAGLDERGLTWFNAGYYPTLDDLAKIALLYQNEGKWSDRQILHRQLTRELLTSHEALLKTGGPTRPAKVADEDVGDTPLYKMGFHFTPYVGGVGGRRYYLPTMWGSGESEVVLYPNQAVSIRIAKAAQIPESESANEGDPQATLRAVDRLAPFA